MGLGYRASREEWLPIWKGYYSHFPSPTHPAGRQICHLPGRVFEGSTQGPDVISPRRVEWANLVLSILDEIAQDVGSSLHTLVQ